MKISNEKFNSLKQLDRIEFRQRKSLIEQKYKGGNTFGIIYILGFTFMIYLLFCAIAYGSFGIEQFKRLVSYIPYLEIMMFYGVLICLAVDLYDYYKKNKELNNLENEYFKVDVK